MALVKSYTAAFKTVFPTAYFRVVKVEIDEPRNIANLEVWVYPDQATRQADGQATIIRILLPVEDIPGNTAFTTYFSVDALSPLGMNPRKAGYQYLKTLGSYAGALDV